MKNERGLIAISIGLFAFIFLLALTLFPIFVASPVYAFNSSVLGNVTSAIWTNGTQNENNLTYGTIWSKTISDWNFYFNENYTNSTKSPISNSSSNFCQIAFNQTGVLSPFVNMTYNSGSLLWQYNQSFNYRGNLSFVTQCNSTYGNISVTDSFFVRPTRPWVNSTTNSNGDNVMNSVNAVEDSLTVINLSAYPYIIINDNNSLSLLSFSTLPGTTLINYTLSSNGILQIYNYSGLTQNISQNLYFSVTDGVTTPFSSILPVNITAVNHPPTFTNLQNQSFNINSNFSYNLSAIDEENNAPFTFVLNFTSCNVAQWSTRNCSLGNSTGPQLFNSSFYSSNGTTLFINFTAGKNDVGNYTLNITVIDLNNVLPPYNASTSQIVNFTVLNVNSAPYFRYVCNNQNSTTEDSPFSCIINVSDIDETSNLTVSANYSWFTFNGTGTSVTLPVNITSKFNATALVNFTPSVSNVGNWSVNVGATDSFGLSNSTLMRLFIGYTNHSVSLPSIGNFSVVSGTSTVININASDNDLLIPDKSVYNENLTPMLNSSSSSWISLSGVQVINNLTSFNFTLSPTDSFIGNNSINLSVYDVNNFSIASQVFYVNVTAGAGGNSGSNSGGGSSGGGGGGGGGAIIVKPASLNLLLPNPLILNQSGIVVLPITLQNNGQVDLTNITLSSSVAVNGQLVSVQQIFSTKNFSKLSPGQQQNLNLSVYLNTSQDGTYEINVNADVQNPKYSDSGKAYITVQNGQVVGDQLSFAEQYILNNTACSNLTSLIDQAKNLYSQNNLPEAQQILANAIEQCKQAIQQVQVTAQQRPLSVSGRVFLYLIVGVILALVIGFGYYMFKQFKLNKIIDENDF